MLKHSIFFSRSIKLQGKATLLISYVSLVAYKPSDPQIYQNPDSLINFWITSLITLIG